MKVHRPFAKFNLCLLMLVIIASSTAMALVLFSASASAAGTANAIEETNETVNLTSSLRIYQYDPKLADVLGAQGTDDAKSTSYNSVCWPTSLAHRMIYFHRHQTPRFTKLRIEAGELKNVAKFVKLCRTSLTGGTSQRRKLPCIREFFKVSGYSGDAYSIGRAAEEKKFRRAVTFQDLIAPLRKGYGVILHVGWLKFDADKKRWMERGSHSVNVYGFSYHPSWENDRIVLQIVNPGVDYSARSEGQSFDSVELHQSIRKDGELPNELIEMELTGPGFSKDGRRAVLRDVFIFYPEKMTTQTH